MRHASILVALLLAATAAQAQRPQIQVSATRRTDSDGRSTSSYSSYKTKEQSQRLQISLRSLDHVPRECQVSWYFTARPTGGGDRFIYDQGTALHVLNATGSTNLSVASTTLRSEKIQYYGDGRPRRYGSEVEGYFVLIDVNGEVVASTASSRPLQQALDNPAKRQQLLDTAQAAADQNVRHNARPMGGR